MNNNMKPIDLTEEQKNKLLEMCQVLFPDLQNQAINETKKWCKDNNEDIDEYEYGFRLSDEISPVIYCSYPIDFDFHIHLLPNDKNPGIHWFEFCTRFLMSKLDALYVEKILDPVDPYGKTNNYGRGSIKDYPDNWSELWNKRIFYEYPNNLNGTFPKKHPVDYLYDEFKKNK